MIAVRSAVCLCSGTSARPHPPLCIRTRLRLRHRSVCDSLIRTNSALMGAQSAPAEGPKDSGMPVDRSYAKRMLNFINYAWTPYHAVGALQLRRVHLEQVERLIALQTFQPVAVHVSADVLLPSHLSAFAEAMSMKLLAAGFQHILEKDTWDIQPGGKYFFTRNMSSVVAFAVGGKHAPGNGVYMVGAHTDSPCLKVKPKSKGVKSGHAMLNVETYGGGLWATWFDRDLSVAGRLLVRGRDGALMHKLVKIEEPIMRIPMLAIHLNRTIGSDGFNPNKQTELVPILATAARLQLQSGITGSTDKAEDDPEGAHHTALLDALAESAACEADDIVDLELNCCDTQPGQLGGLRKEFVYVGRLDNLAMSWCSMQALMDSSGSLAEEAGVRAVALFDHEEVGSSSAVGAGGPLMRDAITRISRALAAGESDAVERCLQRSFLVSADMAHGLHPNYADKHEPDHKPEFHKGLVLKYNQNQRYATNSVTATLFKEVAAKRGIPCQAFVVRNDMPCGSTIGPILASGLGVRTIDVGAAQFAMHSVREMCGTDDIKHAYDHFVAFFEDFGEIDATIDVDQCMVKANGTIDDVPCECL